MRPRILVLLLIVLVLSPAAGLAAGPSADRPGATALSASWWQGFLDGIEALLAAWSGAEVPPDSGTEASGTTNPVAGDHGDDGCHIDPLGCPK